MIRKQFLLLLLFMLGCVVLLNACGDTATSVPATIVQPTQTPVIVVVTNTPPPPTATLVPTPLPPTTSPPTVDPAKVVVLTAEAKDAGKPATSTPIPANDASPLAAYLRTCGNVYTVTISQAYADEFDKGFKGAMPFKYTTNWYSYDNSSGGENTKKVKDCITSFANDNNLKITIEKEDSGMTLIPKDLTKGSIGYEVATMDFTQSALAMGKAGNYLIAIVAVITS